MSKLPKPPTPDFTFDPTRVRDELIRLRHQAQGPGPVPTWSFSVLQDFETCAYRTYLARVEKREQEESRALERGKAIHDYCEKFIRGEDPKPPRERKLKLNFHRHKLEALRDLYSEYGEERVLIEQEWGFDVDWNPTGYHAKDIWARMKCDVVVLESETSIRIIDWKTGGKSGNEPKHGAQGICYGVGAIARFPKVEHVTTEFVYLDHKLPDLVKHFSRGDLMILKPRLHQRALDLTHNHEFFPRPTQWNCRLCGFKYNCEYSMATPRVGDGKNDTDDESQD